MTGGYTSAIVPLMPGCQGSGGLVHDWEGVAESTAKKVPHVNNIKSAPQKHIAFFSYYEIWRVFIVELYFSFSA